MENAASIKRPQIRRHGKPKAQWRVSYAKSRKVWTRLLAKARAMPMTPHSFRSPDADRRRVLIAERAAPPPPRKCPAPEGSRSRGARAKQEMAFDPANETDEQFRARIN